MHLLLKLLSDWVMQFKLSQQERLITIDTQLWTSQPEYIYTSTHRSPSCWTVFKLTPDMYLVSLKPGDSVIAVIAECCLQAILL